MVLPPVHIIAKRTLIAFWERHAPAEQPLRTWFGITKAAHWDAPQAIKTAFGASVDFVAGNRVVFDIGGNKYRLVALVAYRSQRVFVRFVGTHAEYDRIDVTKI